MAMRAAISRSCWPEAANKTMRARSATRTGRDRLRAWDSNRVLSSALNVMAGAIRIRKRFSQVGFAILLTPKGNGTCPICQVTDVTIRYNYISHMGAGMALSNGASDNGEIPLDGGRYSIHDVIFNDINGTKFHGPNLFAQVWTRPGSPVLHDVTINHITAFPKGTSFLIGDVLSADPKMRNFVFTNSIINTGQYPVWSTGTGGSLNCAVHNSPLITLNACFSGYIFSHNALLASPGSYPPSTWPASNFFPTTESAVEFVDYTGGSAGNYALQSTSPYKHAGTDGKDLGANVPGVNAAVAKVKIAERRAARFLHARAAGIQSRRRFGSCAF
jgi:hypothetical protein